MASESVPESSSHDGTTADLAIVPMDAANTAASMASEQLVRAMRLSKSASTGVEHSLISNVTSFDDLRARLKDAGTFDVNDESWLLVTEVAKVCGYKSAYAKEFLRDLVTLGKEAFLSGLPASILPRIRAPFVRLLQALHSIGLKSTRADEGSLVKHQSAGLEQTVFAQIRRVVEEAMKIRPARRLNGKSSWHHGRWIPHTPAMPRIIHEPRGVIKAEEDGPPEGIEETQPPESGKRKLTGLRGSSKRARTAEEASEEVANAEGKNASEEIRGHYDVLRVHSSASSSELRVAFKQCAREACPDGKTLSDVFMAVLQSFSVLSDDERRKAYDKQILASGADDGQSTQEFLEEVADLVRRETEDVERIVRLAARKEFNRLCQSRSLWQQEIASLDDARLHTLIEWMEGFLFSGQTTSNSRSYAISDIEEHTLPGIRLTGDHYLVELRFGRHHVSATCKSTELGLAVDRYAAFVRMREAWKDRTASTNDDVLLEEDVSAGLELEPTMRPLIGMVVPINRRKQIELPRTIDLERGLPYFRVVWNASKVFGSRNRVESLVERLKVKIPELEEEMKERDWKIYHALHNERLVRASKAAGRSVVSEPWTPRIASVFDLPKTRVRTIFSQLEALPPAERARRLTLLLHGAPVDDGEDIGSQITESIPAVVTGALGLPTDTAKSLLDFLQLRSLSMLEMSSTRCLSLTVEAVRKRRENFVFSSEGKGCLLSSSTKLLEFLTIKRHAESFQSLDLRDAPLDALAAPSLHQVLPEMQRLHSVWFQSKGWPERKALNDFLAVLPDGCAKNPAAKASKPSR